MNIPQLHTLSRASQLSLLAIIILMGAVFLTVNSALQQQNTASKASGPTNMLLDPSFESGKGSWTLTTAGPGAGTFTTTTSQHADGAASGQVTITGTSSTARWDIQLKQSNVSIQAGQTYTLSYWAKASSNRQIDAEVQQEGSPFTLYKEMSPMITTTWQQYSTTFTVSATQTNAFVGFNLAQSTGTVWIDGVTLSSGTISSPTVIPVPTNKPLPTAVPTAVPTAKPVPTAIPTAKPTPAPTSVPIGNTSLVNPSFEIGTTGWNLNLTSPAVATFTTTTSTAAVGAASAKVDISTASTSTTNYYAQLRQDNVSIQSGKTYTVTFWSKASSARQIRSVVQMIGNPHTVYDNTYVNLSTAWQQYSYTFTASATDTVFLGFNVGDTTGTVWIDGVTISNGTGSLPTATPLPPTPTTLPNATTTPFPTATPTVKPTQAPTQIPLPTATPVPGASTLSITVGLHGIGTGGDSANPNSTGNTSPLKPSRSITADIYDAQNQLVVSQQGTVTYNSASGKFIGNLNLGTNFATGLYTVKIKSDQYLRALVPGIQNITAGKTTTIPAVTLVAGDINGDNAINIIDYNILIGCYSDLLPATNCNATDNVLSDITDDGHVNQFDYNLFLRELTNIGGQ